MKPAQPLIEDRAKQDRAKRGFDVLVASVVFVITLPLQLLTAVAIRFKLGSPVLFKHTRPGLHAEPFEMIKFRTMANVDPGKEAGDESEAAQRLTPFGLWLRATSLDELPTLWNVIRGDLSLVGPRPLMVSYLELYSPEQARRHQVRPGVTGLAQVTGRNSLSWEDKFRLDVEYVDHHTFLGDLLIILRTVRSVASRHGVAVSGEATFNFQGSKKAQEDT